MQMICPSCARPMEHVTRHGVELDRCEVCGGIWLDRGELEQLFEAVRSPVVLPEPQTPSRPKSMPEVRREAAPRRAKSRDDDRPYKHGKPYKKGYKKRSTTYRLKKIIDEIFD